MLWPMSAAVFSPRTARSTPRPGPHQGGGQAADRDGVHSDKRGPEQRAPYTDAAREMAVAYEQYL
ncbi:MAG: hypothetical protein AAGC72_13560 [Planctomycetota bacterium]